MKVNESKALKLKHASIEKWYFSCYEGNGKIKDYAVRKNAIKNVLKV